MGARTGENPARAGENPARTGENPARAVSVRLWMTVCGCKGYG